MKATSGWWNEDEYIVVKSLHNGCRQQLFMSAAEYDNGRWNIYAGVFSCNSTYNSIRRSSVWGTCTSTNKNPSLEVLKLALEALSEIEKALSEAAKGKKWFIYIDGMDERRLRVYTKVLTKKEHGYKKSRVISKCGLPILYKKV